MRKLKPVRIQQSADLINRIEQDHRAVKRRIQPMLGFKSTASARVFLGGIEMVHMMRNGQARYACKRRLSPAGSPSYSPHEPVTDIFYFRGPAHALRQNQLKCLPLNSASSAIETSAPGAETLKQRFATHPT
ncbi:DDE domain-containing protein [Microvirga guangxiensis]|uniref:DDE domain-containing protein n=1 Tax=Microvirga guangxiensis TaxID=549386 RepID=A0A1G5LP43_9HYPH|nr:DDE domain-containing protein [Microvirga guangxiensis]